MRGSGAPSGVRPYVSVAVAVAAILVGSTGCGGDESSEGQGSEQPRYSEASEPAKVFAERMAKLLETTDTKRECPQLEKILERSLARLSCPPDKKLSRSMARFEVVGAREYGTGAVVDYTSGQAKDGAALVLYSAPDRNWAVSRFGIITKPSTKTSDEQSRAGFREAVDDYLSAIRTRNCKTFMAVTLTGDRPRGEVCRTSFRASGNLRLRLAANPKAEPRYEGGNAVYGFFTLETRRPEPVRETISVVKANAKSSTPYLVLDIAPSPTTEQQRAVVEQLNRDAKAPAAEPDRPRQADP